MVKIKYGLAEYRWFLIRKKMHFECLLKGVYLINNLKTDGRLCPPKYAFKKW